MDQPQEPVFSYLLKQTEITPYSSQCAQDSRLAQRLLKKVVLLKCRERLLKWEAPKIVRAPEETP